MTTKSRRRPTGSSPRASRTRRLTAALTLMGLASAARPPGLQPLHRGRRPRPRCRHLSSACLASRARRRGPLRQRRRPPQWTLAWRRGAFPALSCPPLWCPSRRHLAGVWRVQAGRALASSRRRRFLHSRPSPFPFRGFTQSQLSHKLAHTSHSNNTSTPAVLEEASWNPSHPTTPSPISPLRWHHAARIFPWFR